MTDRGPNELDRAQRRGVGVERFEGDRHAGRDGAAQVLALAR